MIQHTGYITGQAATGGKVHIISTWTEDGKDGYGTVCGADMAQSRTSARNIRRGYVTVIDAQITCSKCNKWLAARPHVTVK